MAWTTLNFGKHEGKTLPQVLFKDPDYFFWACENGVFNNCSEEIQKEAARLYAKATSIKLPEKDGPPLVVEYKFQLHGGNFVDFEIIEEGHTHQTGSTTTEQFNYIDMSFIRLHGDYKKGAYKIFMAHLKAVYFGDQSHHMTKERCEEFFDDDANFHNNG